MENNQVSKSLKNIREGIFATDDIDRIRNYIEKLETNINKGLKIKATSRKNNFKKNRFIKKNIKGKL